MTDLILAREARRLGLESVVARRCRRGELVAITPGVFVDAGVWQRADADERYRLIVQGVGRRHPGILVSHQSAAALWRLPSLRPWPRVVHTRADRAGGGQSSAAMRRHGLGLVDDVTMIDGVQVTSLAQTAADLATLRDFAAATVFLDAALGGRHEGASVTRSEVLASIVRAPSFAPVRARRTLAFADGRSESPGESLSRAQFHILGLPAPALQVSFRDGDGEIVPDFYWEHLDLAGEFDGGVKYSDQRAYQRTMSAWDVLREEKAREERLRRIATGGVVRWGWATALDRAKLVTHLAPFGLVPSGHRART